MRTRAGFTIAVVVLLATGSATGQLVAKDPGVRNDTSAAGKPLKGLSASQIAFFEAGKDDFAEAEIVADGLGPRFNLDSCAGCHIQPAIGGTSPRSNPQVPLAKAFGALNNVPSFIREDGPIREARYRYKPDGSRDGGVHALYVISGRVDGRGSDARDCTIKQEDFESEVAKNNVSFRIPTPTFGLGLVEQIPDSAIAAKARADAAAKTGLGIIGRPHRLLPTGNPNRNGNDGTIARFGWKAQNKSLLLFAGEAYNVEMGITNELFQSERDETAACQYAPTPNDFTNTDAQTPLEALTGIEKFAVFMRFLAPPTPSLTTPGGAASLLRGRALFATTGCALCHTPAFKTGESSVAALSGKDVPLFSDLLLHHMGPGLADDVLQGVAEGDEFRTAPLWGLGQRIFFLHDGRTNDLAQAILAHQSAAGGRFQASEANRVIDRYKGLGETQKQDLMNFLRSL